MQCVAVQDCKWRYIKWATFTILQGKTDCQEVIARKHVKVKEVDLYSAFIEVPYT